MRTPTYACTCFSAQLPTTLLFELLTTIKNWCSVCSFRSKSGIENQSKFVRKHNNCKEIKRAVIGMLEKRPSVECCREVVLELTWENVVSQVHSNYQKVIEQHGNWAYVLLTLKKTVLFFMALLLIDLHLVLLRWWISFLNPKIWMRIIYFHLLLCCSVISSNIN